MATEALPGTVLLRGSVSGVATDFQVGGRGHDLKTYLPTPIFSFSSVLGLLILLTPRLHNFAYFFQKQKQRTSHLCGELGLGLMLMHSMTRVNKYALRQVEAESNDP